jgi:hypothetical protein
MDEKIFLLYVYISNTSRIIIKELFGKIHTHTHTLIHNPGLTVSNTEKQYPFMCKLYY